MNVRVIQFFGKCLEFSGLSTYNVGLGKWNKVVRTMFELKSRVIKETP